MLPRVLYRRDMLLHVLDARQRVPPERSSTRNTVSPPSLKNRHFSLK
jgi:hypothetical protein